MIVNASLQQLHNDTLGGKNDCYFYFLLKGDVKNIYETRDYAT